ncbi:MAG: SUA5 protein [Candidatus Levybacteria bacterium GW2011_GWA2_40_8]|nr:MAG: SUA5 protein [Candidatus Levybacteria bacterium GW2011_GWA2_40_8]
MKNDLKQAVRIKRPESQATPVLFESIGEVSEYVSQIPPKALSLMEKYWPGALTIILSAKTRKIPRLVRGGGQTIGVRIPNHSITLEMIRRVGVPILGPSANFHGEPAPFRLEDLDKNLISKVDYILAGETKLRKPSTVIDCTVFPFRVLRLGGVVDI